MNKLFQFRCHYTHANLKSNSTIQNELNNKDALELQKLRLLSPQETAGGNTNFVVDGIDGRGEVKFKITFFSRNQMPDNSMIFSNKNILTFSKMSPKVFFISFGKIPLKIVKN